MTIDGLRQEGEALHQELARTEYLALAGFSKSADLDAAYRRHPLVTDPDSLVLVRDALTSADEGSEQERAARLLLEWQVDLRSNRSLAEADERRIEWEASATVPVPGRGSIPFQRIAIEIANTKDRAEREVLDDARATLVERELAPMRRDRLQRERELVESLKLAPSYSATISRLSGMDLQGLAAQCAQFLSDTAELWRDTLRENLRVHGIPHADATRADLLALFRSPEFEVHFPAALLQPAVRRQVTEMGGDPDAGGRIRYDTEEREGKRSRAFCAPVRIPDEVYLVLRPQGGVGDWRTLLHELGHAMHFASMRASLPFEQRWVGDNSVTEGYAMLFDHLLLDRGWLRRYSDLRGDATARFLRHMGFEELQFLRRYCAKLQYELALYDGTNWDSLPDVYVETLGNATSVRYRGADAFVDVDPGFYSARYLRAWQLQAALADALRDRFDEDWFRNPRAGPFLVGQLMAEGQRETVEELTARAGAAAPGFAPLIRQIESLLG